MQERKSLSLVTQNVDGLHQLAGSTGVIELHGNIRRVKCFDHGHPAGRWEDGAEVPTCARCGSLLRPDVVWFGEMLAEDAIAAAIRAAAGCDVFLAVVEVNPAATPLSGVADIVLRGAAGEVLPRLVPGKG